ncbi:MAG: methyltransferase domain-containing protein, partial [Actinobacteria bacterium]|nr:methyltransferase domain-containing protein [Actinomycetota bacterium]
MQEPDHDAAARAVYDHSAAKFVAAIGTEVSSQFEAPLDRAVLLAFAESILAVGSGPVLDVGCGPGRIAAFLAERGIEASGVDIAPQMIAEARLAHPDLVFEVGTLT